MNMLDLSDLWTPMRGAVTDAKKDAWLRSRSIKFHGFPEWPLPDEETWREDPFSNNTWKLWYHCLTWLYVPAAIFDSEGDTVHLDLVRRYTLDWMSIHASAFMAEPSDIAWDDHAIAYRSTFLIYVYRKYFVTDPEWADAFRSSMALHARLLYGFLRRPEFYGNNHGVFHCFALLNLAAAVPEVALPPEYKPDAEQRLFELLDEMIDTREGVTREQAAEYQYIALELVGQVIEYSRFFGLDDENVRVSELRGLMTRLVDFAFAMRWPDGSVPAVGDTWLYWNGWSRPLWEMLEGYVASGYGSEATKQAIRQLREGTAPNASEATDVTIYPRSGYLLVRGAAWAVFMKAGPSVHSHGHHDHLNVQMFLDGELLLVDSGGPYKYSDPQREYFTHPRAHNTVICLGQSGFHAGVAESDVGAVVTDAVSQMGGKQPLADGLVHTRNVVFFHESRTLVVYDEIVAGAAGREHEIEQFWHFPPGMSIHRLASDRQDAFESLDFALTVPNGKSYKARLVSDCPTHASLVEGQVTPKLQGWVTRKVGTMEAAPVIDVGMRIPREGRAASAFVIWADDGNDRSVALPIHSHGGHSGFRFRMGPAEWDVRFGSHRLVRAVRSTSRSA